MECHMPTPTPQHKTLARLAANWIGDDTMFPSQWDPKGGTARSTFKTQMACDGFFLVGDYAQERDGKVVYRGHGVFGYDEKDGVFTMYWFDSMGGGGYTTPSKGKWHGDTLQFEQVTPMGHMRHVYEFESANRMTFRIDVSRDGANFAPMMASRYRHG